MLYDTAPPLRRARADRSRNVTWIKGHGEFVGNQLLIESKEVLSTCT